MKTIKEQLINILQETGTGKNMRRDQFTENSELTLDLGYDSLDLAILRVNLEEEFHISLRESQVGEKTHLKDLYALIEKKLTQQRPADTTSKQNQLYNEPYTEQPRQQPFC